MPRSDKNLIFCVHAHQPVGNFDRVFEEAFERCYRPFFEVLGAHPAFPVSCHLSGSLLDWLELNKPQWLAGLRKRASAGGNLEFLGGAYYEPIYGAIPRHDLTGQIEMMREKLMTLFGQDPKGAWLTERVWDPELVGPLSQAGVAYTVLDDCHLEQAGVVPPVGGHFQVRDKEGAVDVFASAKHLRYLMPFRAPQDTLDYIHSLESEPEDVLVFADDCEKFGLWPGTHRWVYKQKWLHRLFSLLEKDKKINLTTFREYRLNHRPGRTVRIPHGSYSEMMDWSGGRFYNFFDKYPESRYMRDRMWRLSSAVEKRGLHSKNASVKKARQAIWRAQCNCSYWHGVFGGLYLHHLRSAVFQNLIKAGQMMRESGAKKGHGNQKAELALEPFESGPRWTLRQSGIVSFFNPAYGAALEELDFLPKSVNLMCNLQRQHEPYHQLVTPDSKGVWNGGTALFSIRQILGSKEKGLERHLYYDPIRRLSFMDHFFERDISAEEFQKSLYAEAGDFVGAPYVLRRAVLPAYPAGRGAPRLLFRRKGGVKIAGQSHALLLSKEVSPLRGAGLKVRYRLKNLSDEILEFVFGVEFNFSIGDTKACAGLSRQGIRKWVFEDSWTGSQIRLESDRDMNFLTAAVETVSESEGGMEKTYQELASLCQFSLKLKPKEQRPVDLELEVR